MAAERSQEPWPRTSDGMTDAECRIALDELERYRLLARSARDVILVLRADGRIIEANDAAVKAYGYSHDELLTHTIYDLRAEGTLPSVRTQMERAERHGLLFETVHRRKDGSTFPIEASSNGAIIGGEKVLVSIVRDITARKRTEQALEAERTRLRTVLATLPVGVVIADASGRMLEMNEATRRIWGRDTPLAQGVSEYVEYKGWRPDTGERYNSEDWALARALTKGETIVGEVIDIERFDGARATILNSAAPIRDDQGNITGAVVTVQDITDLRVAEEEVRRSRDLLQAIIDNTPAAIYVKNTDGTIILANKAIADLIGRQRDEMIGKTTFDFYPSEVAEQHTANDREIMRRGEPESFEEVVPEDGSVRTFLSVKFPLKDDEGHVYGVGGVSTEITERVRADEKVREALDRESNYSLQLQRALLPPEIKPLDGYGVAHTFVSPFAGREVGGDFYDVFSTESGCIGIVMGDVSGKGLEAASVAANTRATVRAFAYDMNDAGHALSHANDVICAQQPGKGTAFFVTVFLGILHPGTGEMSFASAGHPPPAIYHAATGDVEFPTFGNPPIGVLSRYEYGEGTAHLAPGDRIVLYTDGLSEARDGEGMFEVEGIERVLKANVDVPPQALVDALLSAACEWSHDHLRDDTAILVICRE